MKYEEKNYDPELLPHIDFWKELDDAMKINEYGKDEIDKLSKEVMGE